jgi:hypothetical protein
MSSPTKEQAVPGDVSPLAAKLALEKKKIKVLKTALREERGQRTNIEKELKAAYDRIEQLKLEI